MGADSGLKVRLGDESNPNVPSGKSNDVELVQAGGGLRNRKQGHTRSSSTGSASLHHIDEDARRPAVSDAPNASEHNQLVVGHYNPQGPAVNDGGWLARIAALLVGEDPTQSYALICGNCHMHNGESILLYPLHHTLFFNTQAEGVCISLCIYKRENTCTSDFESNKIHKDYYNFISFLPFVGLVKKEDFPFITYYCPHCHALNRSNQSEEQISGHGSPTAGSIKPRSTSDPIILTSNVDAETISEIQEAIEQTESANLVSEEEKVHTAETT